MIIFVHADKWYKSESVSQTEMHKILWVFETQIDQPILARKLDLVLINKKKKKFSSSGFCPSSRLESKNKRKCKDRWISGSCQRTEKAMEHESDINCSWHSWNNLQGPGK